MALWIKQIVHYGRDKIENELADTSAQHTFSWSCHIDSGHKVPPPLYKTSIGSLLRLILPTRSSLLGSHLTRPNINISFDTHPIPLNQNSGRPRTVLSKSVSHKQSSSSNQPTHQSRNQLHLYDSNNRTHAESHVDFSCPTVGLHCSEGDYTP